MPRSVSVPDEATWLAVRESHIGGSEIACLFYRWRLAGGDEIVAHMFEEVPEEASLLGCLSPFKSGYRLWQEKSGALAPDSFAENERVQAGIHLEPALAAWAGEKWDMRLRKVRRYLQHDEVEGWGASLDYELFGGGLSGTPVEFKNIDGGVFRSKWMASGDEILLPPLNYLLQVQHQIGAAGTDHGWIVACVGGNSLVRGRIERHEASQEKIAAAVTAFWAAVRAGVEPARLADYETVAKAHPSAYKDSSVDLTGDDTLPMLCGQYLRLKAHIERMEVRAENLKGRIALAIGDSAKAKTAGYRLSWPSITRAEKTIPARVQPALTYRGGLTITRIEEVKQ